MPRGGRGVAQQEQTGFGSGTVNSNSNRASPPEDPEDPESSVAHLHGADHDWFLLYVGTHILFACTYTQGVHAVVNLHRSDSPGRCATMYRKDKLYMCDQLTIPSKIGRHVREKGAVVGPDTFLARTLIFAVRLSAWTDRWEGAGRRGRRAQSGLQQVHA